MQEEHSLVLNWTNNYYKPLDNNGTNWFAIPAPQEPSSLVIIAQPTPYYVKEVNSLERIHHVVAESKEEAISLVSEFIDNDVDDYVIEETMTEEPLIVKTFEEDEEEN